MYEQLSLSLRLRPSALLSCLLYFAAMTSATVPTFNSIVIGKQTEIRRVAKVICQAMKLDEKVARRVK